MGSTELIVLGYLALMITFKSTVSRRRYELVHSIEFNLRLNFISNVRTTVNCLMVTVCAVFVGRLLQAKKKINNIKN